MVINAGYVYIIRIFVNKIMSNDDDVGGDDLKNLNDDTPSLDIFTIISQLIFL